MVAEEVVALLVAARNGDLSSLDSDKVTETLQDQDGANCLHYAVRGGSVPVLKHLVNTRGFNPLKRSNVGATALHDAAAAGQLEALQWLLEQKDAKVDDQDGTGATVTHLSARYGHTQSLEWLLDETNCDVMKKAASGALPLHFAAEGGHLECVKILTAEAPSSINMQMNNGSTSAYLACQSGHLMIADYLAAKNGSPKIHTFDGMSPLHAAAQTGQLHIVKWLIQDQGLNPNERDFDGATPLHYAASRGHSGVVDWLLREGGARIILDNLGGSPLHTAAQFGNNKIVNTLLKNGCDRDITDNQGLTAEELAEKCGHDKTVSILRGETVSEDSGSEPQRPNGTTPASKPPPQPQTQSAVSRSAPSTSTVSPPQPQPVTSSPAATTKRAAPPPPAPKPSTPIQLRSATGRSSSAATGRSSSATRTSAGLEFTLENLPSEDSSGLIDRSTSVVSVASSASSFGYFSPHSGGKTEVVSADIHNIPSQVCVFNSQETGEREVGLCAVTGKPLPKVTPEEFSKASASAAFYLSASSTASSASKLPPVKSSYLSPAQHSPVSSDSLDSNSSSVRESRGAQRTASGQLQKPQRGESPSVAARKALLQAATQQKSFSALFVSRVSTMEDVKVNGVVANGNSSTTSVSSNSSAGSGGGAAKSVIKISNKNVTIISTGKDGANPSKVKTTPLRSNGDQTLSGAHVSTRKKDTEFISALTQKFQANGSANNFVRPAPVASSANYKGGNAQSTSSTSSLRQQQTAAIASVLQKRQQASENVSPNPPSSAPLVNGHAEAPSSAETNGLNGDSSSGEVPPPPPPPPAPVRSVSEQPAVRKADASYTPRPKSYSTQSSVNGSIPGTPRSGGGANYPKNDLMAALTAVVTSGSPSASLRKTRGPGRGGVSEVYSSKKSSGATTPNGTEKQSSPLPPIDEFDPKNFLDQVADTDNSGNKIPDWKRQMFAKTMAQKAHEEYVEKKKVEDYEARFKNMPAWKRALIEKKEGNVSGK